METKRGALAYCSQGMLGLITSDEPEKVTYDDGNSAMAWTGIHMSYGTWVIPGDPWSSRDPTVVGYIDDVDGFVKRVKEYG